MRTKSSEAAKRLAAKVAAAEGKEPPPKPAKPKPSGLHFLGDPRPTDNPPTAKESAEDVARAKAEVDGIINVICSGKYGLRSGGSLYSSHYLEIIRLINVKVLCQCHGGGEHARPEIGPIHRKERFVGWHRDGEGYTKAKDQYRHH